ncbi:MAG: hypothetical protein UW69_C0040G0010 [Microgenomates group bacterium GW2011_GWA2_44_7]|nr:MAG: hypothetical protein UW69_C0040G0010 [Microgenomates group bacterium GW2011_GWA2_44_7]
MKPMPLANSLATATAICWVAMSLFIWILPELSLKVYQGWLMGVVGLSATGFNLDLATFLGGGVTMVAFTWVFGYFWGSLYRKLS